MRFGAKYEEEVPAHQYDKLPERHPTIICDYQNTFVKYFNPYFYRMFTFIYIYFSVYLFNKILVYSLGVKFFQSFKVRIAYRFIDDGSERHSGIKCPPSSVSIAFTWS